MGRIEEAEAYRARVRDCSLCGEDVIHTKEIKSIPAYIHAEKCEVLVVGMAPDKKDHNAKKEPTPFTGEFGNALRFCTKEAKIFGDFRFGYTTLTKCQLKNGRVKQRCIKNCMSCHLNWEIEFLNPRVIVLMGEEVTKFVLPSIIKSQKDLIYSGGYMALEGTSFTFIDRTYFFVKDPLELFSSNKFMPGEHHGDELILIDNFKKVRELL